MTELVKVNLSVTHNSSLETIYRWYTGHKSTDIGFIAGVFPVVRKRLLVKTLLCIRFSSVAKYTLAELLTVVKKIPRGE